MIVIEDYEYLNHLPYKTSLSLDDGCPDYKPTVMRNYNRHIHAEMKRLLGDVFTIDASTFVIDQILAEANAKCLGESTNQAICLQCRDSVLLFDTPQDCVQFVLTWS